MKRVIIIGCPGSGKSTFAKKLAEITRLPLFHLDNIWWKADKTSISTAEFKRLLSSIIIGNEWIIDGDYSNTYEMRMEACDTIIFLDYSIKDCLKGIESRVGMKRSDMPWIEERVDPDLVEIILNYGKEKRPLIMKLLKEHKEKEIFVFNNRKEANEWLKEYNKIK